MSRETRSIIDDCFVGGKPVNEVFGKMGIAKGELIPLPGIGAMNRLNRGCNALVSYDLGNGITFIPMETSSEEALAKLVELRRRAKDGTGSPH